MRSGTTESRTRFYQQESSAGSHLSPAYNQSVLRELLSSIRSQDVTRIGDLGSGSGSNLAALRDLFGNARIVTLDLNQAALAAGRDAQPNAMPAQSDAAAIPLASRTLDLIVCTEVIEHVNAMKPVFQEMNRVLAKRGWALISSPNYLNPMGIRKWANDRRLGNSYWDPWGGHPGFERLMLPSSTRRAFHTYFDLMTVRGAGFIMGWIPLGYRRIGRLNDRFPMQWVGRLPLLRNVAINRYLLLRRKAD